MGKDTREYIFKFPRGSSLADMGQCPGQCPAQRKAVHRTPLGTRSELSPEARGYQAQTTPRPRHRLPHAAPRPAPPVTSPERAGPAPRARHVPRSAARVTEGRGPHCPIEALRDGRGGSVLANGRSLGGGSCVHGNGRGAAAGLSHRAAPSRAEPSRTRSAAAARPLESPLRTRHQHAPRSYEAAAPLLPQRDLKVVPPAAARGGGLAAGQPL